MKNSIKEKDHIIFIFVFILTTGLQYILPELAKQLYFLILIIIFWRSDNNSFWFALFFALSETQNLFLSFAHKQTLLPAFNILPGGLRNLYMEEIFLFAFLLKATLKKKKVNSLFNSYYLLLFLYLLLLFVISFIIGVDQIKILATIRNTLPLLLVFAIPMLFSKKDYESFFGYIFSILFIILISQIAEVVTGSKLSFLVTNKYDYIYQQNIIDPYEDIARPLYAIFLVLLCYLGAVYYLVIEKNRFSKTYLYFVLFGGLGVTLLSATRGFFLSYLLMLIFYFLKYERGNYLRVLLRTIVISIVFGIALYFIPTVQEQIENAWTRILTVEYLFSGDLTAGGTLVRLTDRLPRVLSKFVEHPIIGLGFSTEYYNYMDFTCSMYNVIKRRSRRFHLFL